MASRVKLTPKRRNLQIEDGDIFSALPKHLVSHILSFLPTEDAIRTSILSKRWRFRWTTISNLNFNDGKICELASLDEDGNSIDQVSVNTVKCFIDYVNNVLLHLESTSVDSFSIFLDDCDNRLQIENWISAALKLNVRCLSLYGLSISGNPIDLPRQVFDCKSLESLSLSLGVILNIPNQGFTCFPNLKFLSLDCVSICGIPANENENSACFPKLETLHLKQVNFVRKDECVMKLIRNCPFLKDLLIARNIQNNVSNSDMCIPILTSVELYLGDREVGTKVEIQAPIKHLRIVSFNPTHKLFVKNPGSLITAEVRMSNIETEDYEAEQRVLYDFQGEQKDNVFKFMKTLETVKRLNLGAYTVTVIRASQIDLPLFCNLIRLEVQLNCKNLCVIHYLLNNSDKLQTLVIDKFNSPCCIEDEQWMEFPHVPKCLITSLKWVEIHGFDGCTHRLDMIKNVLKCAETLKKLSIKYRFMRDGDRSTLYHKISTFPRASAACVLDFFIFVRRFGCNSWAKY